MRTSNTFTTVIWRKLLMLDRERVLAKIDQIEGYLRELREIVPKDFVTYQ